MIYVFKLIDCCSIISYGCKSVYVPSASTGYDTRDSVPHTLFVPVQTSANTACCLMP